ncbi:MAG: dihydropyrimidinase [Acidimicrobiia bacterium]|jgi:dihydropyrimidinase|nr:dihydropyrimidinase [Acidimicrobiia bacterium]
MDLIVRGGTVVTPSAHAVTDIGIDGGTIVQLGGPMTAPREIDASGRYVLPGGIDLHVHLTPTGSEPHSWRWVDDFSSGTAAALLGGITTVGNMSHPARGEGMADSVKRDTVDGEASSRCDFVLHPVLMEPTGAEVQSIEDLAAAGHTSIKVFLSFRRFEKAVSGYLEGLRRAAKVGSLALLHCEDIAIMDCCCAILREEGRTHPRHFPEARPVAAERAATERAVAFAEITGCGVYVVHLAAGAALASCRDAQARGLPVYVETRPLYLHLTKERFEEADGAKYAGAPPLREKADVDALWAGIAQGTVATLATDHAPWTLEQKLDPELDATDMRLGAAELETSLPMLWWAGVRSGRISLRRFVEVSATNPAKLAGIFPRKGTIAVGSDADLVLWDAERTKVIDGSVGQSRAGWSPYDGWSVTGWPSVVVSRGEVVVEGGRLTDLARPGRGHLLHRSPYQRL